MFITCTHGKTRSNKTAHALCCKTDDADLGYNDGSWIPTLRALSKYQFDANETEVSGPMKKFATFLVYNRLKDISFTATRKKLMNIKVPEWKTIREHVESNDKDCDEMVAVCAYF